MYMRKSNGPSTVPWGTPETTLVQVECSTPKTTLFATFKEVSDPGVCIIVDAISV